MAATKPKQGGNANMEQLMDLINKNFVDVNNFSPKNVEAVQEEDFRHHIPKKWCCNFVLFLAMWDLEAKYSGVQYNGGKMQCLYFLSIIMHVLII